MNKASQILADIFEDFYSRSVIGMMLALIKKGFSKEEAEKQIQTWVENGQLVPTWTNDDHFILPN
jgi:hypothetical protein